MGLASFELDLALAYLRRETRDSSALDIAEHATKPQRNRALEKVRNAALT